MRGKQQVEVYYNAEYRSQKPAWGPIWARGHL